MITHDTINQAFELFLGRSPANVTALNYPNFEALLVSLYGSQEFKRSDRSKKFGTTWPEAQYFYSNRNQIVFCPIGKNACSYFKSAMVKIEQHPDQGTLLNSIHFLTDHVRTGMQLSDYPQSQAASILADPDVYKFAILRDPARRLLSAYIEKFVKNRMEASNLKFHTSPVIQAVQVSQGIETPDFHRGISFEGFIEHIISQPPHLLDAHWRPQHLYLGGHQWPHLFTFEQIPQAIAQLEERSGVSLSLPALNQSGSGEGEALDGAHQLLPAQLDERSMISKESFLTSKIQMQINQYYAQDYALIAQI